MNDRKSRVAALGCIICQRQHPTWQLPPANVHHLIGIKYRATGKKADDEYTIPLCHFHHQGQEGIHTLGMRAWERKYSEQSYLLDLTNEALAIKYHEPMK